MDIQDYLDLAPWEWPENAGDFFYSILEDKTADESDRIIAADLAGDFVVINDKLAEKLISIACNNDESDKMRGQAAVSLGPALENAYMMEFDDPDDILISEETFHMIEESLKGLFMNMELSKQLRRMALEASIHSPQDWHREAIQTAYHTDDEEWKLTSVFCMRFVKGFNKQIIETLNNPDPNIQYQAICAAGNWEVKEAEPVINFILTTPGTDKDLVLAAIESVVGVCPEKAPQILDHLFLSDDEDIIDAVHETMALSGWSSDFDDDWEEEDDDEGYLH